MKKFLLFSTALLLAIAVILPSCTKEEGTEETETPTGVSISGNINNVTDIQVIGATVSFVSPTRTYSGITDDNGDYAITGIIEGAYTVTIEAPGYDTKTETNVNVTSGSIHSFDLLGSATVTGKVLNSQTGQGVANAEVEFYTVSKKSNDDFIYVVFRLYTNAEGIYHLGGLPTGFFNVRMVSPGFNENTIINITIVSGENNMGEATIVENVAEGQIRIVLSWGEAPYDLDSHLTGPNSSGGRFHLYFSYDNVNDGTEAYLDVDDTDSYGPETITIHQYLDGLYRYSIHNYSDQSTEGGLGIYNSPTKVEIFDSNGILGTYAPKPFTAGAGNTWRVLEFSVTNGVISINGIDEYVYASSAGNIDDFKSSEKNTTFNISDF